VEKKSIKKRKNTGLIRARRFVGFAGPCKRLVRMKKTTTRGKKEKYKLGEILELDTYNRLFPCETTRT
jgi:hypothetical protein